MQKYIADGVNKEVCLTVYNTGLQSVREVCVIPSSKWGGSGILGCQLLSGATCKIPKMLSDDIPQQTAHESQVVTFVESKA